MVGWLLDRTLGSDPVHQGSSGPEVRPNPQLQRSTSGRKADKTRLHAKHGRGSIKSVPGVAFLCELIAKHLARLAADKLNQEFPGHHLGMVGLFVDVARLKREV
jgi:hypothetical protein